MSAEHGQATRRIAALGECMIELCERRDATLSRGYAGDTLNTATYLRRLLPAAGYRVDYVTATGEDHLSERMIASWQAEGIGTELVQRLPGELPGLYWIRTDERGEREFFYWRGHSAARKVLSNDHAGRIDAALNEGDLLYLSGISLAILAPESRYALLELLEALHRRRVRIAYDANFRARLWEDTVDARRVQQRLLESVDVYISSFPDEAALFGDADIEQAAKRLAGCGVAEWILRGDPGVTLTAAGSRSTASPIDSRPVVDTTGAGDSFDAAYLAARLQGHAPAPAIDAGHALARLVVQHRGAIIPREATPTLAELLSN
ncbi:MAG: sugar kinase [Woeseiaceae bacterium]